MTALGSVEGPSRPLRVGCMTFFDPRAPQGSGLLRHPYGIEELEKHGISLIHVTVDWGHRRPLRDVEAVRQMLRVSKDVDVVFAMFESQANAVALARRFHVPGSRRVPLVVLTCWLAEEVLNAGWGRRRLFQFSYGSVDRLLFFSSNQEEIFESHLGMPASRLTAVPFGVDFSWFESAEVTDEGYVVSVGRDLGRDWQTLFDAVRGTGLDVRIACRPTEIDGFDIPDEVTVEGFLSRDRYRRILSAASAVVQPTHVRAYPTGQSVALEAMAMGKCLIATDTPAISDYLDDETAVLVPVGDAAALRSAILDAASRPDMRSRMGAAARHSVSTRFSSHHMWDAVAEVLADEAGRSRRGGRRGASG